MEILAVIGIIVVILVVFTGGGILGWMLRGVEMVFGFLLEGNQNCLGCFIKIILAFFFIFVVVGLLGLL